MTTHPGLSLFPSIEQVEKRREDLDALIQKSMDRPTRRFPSDIYINGTKRTPSRSRTRTPAHDRDATKRLEGPSVDQVRPSMDMPAEPKEEVSVAPIEPGLHHAVTQEDLSVQKPHLVYEIPRSYTSPPEFNPYIMKTDPLPPPPVEAGLSRQISRSPAKRMPSRTASTRGRDRQSNASTRTSTFSPASTVHSSAFSALTETPMTEASVYSDFMQSSPQHKMHESPSQQPMHYAGSLRRNAFGPVTRRPSQSNESIVSLGNARAPSRASMASNMTVGMAVPPREMSSRTSHRHQGSIPEYSSRYTVDSSSGSTEFSSSNSTDSSRQNSLLTNPEDFYLPDREKQPIKSIFPTYDPHLPLAHQSYYPSRPAPSPVPAEDIKIRQPSPEPESTHTITPISTRYDNLTALKDLDALWNVSNGQITTQVPGVYNLKMYRPGIGKKRTRLLFGTSEDDIFYTLNHVRPPHDADDEYPHETLIFRHHAAAMDQLATTKAMEQHQDDLLPIAHSQILPPPPPVLSRSNKTTLNTISQEPATHITTVTPVLATLHALDHASKSPQAHKLALVDPKAESPAAARLAERAVKAASDRESCTLTWMRTCPQSGKYELHHPSLGVFTVVVEGNVRGAMESSNSTRGPTSISIMNPFAQVSPAQADTPTLDNTVAMRSPTQFAFGLARGSGIGTPRSIPTTTSSDAGLLARLDFSRDLLHLDVPAIQSLGNIYLLDVCVSTLLAVAIAEGSRAIDPGLIFAAPPTSLAVAKRSKSNRIFGSSASKVAGSNAEANKSTVSLVVMPKKGKKDGRRGTLTTIDWTTASAVMGIEHLVDSRDLPRITRGILSVIGAAFKTALWLLEFGVRISARMVIGLSKLAEKV